MKGIFPATGEEEAVGLPFTGKGSGSTVHLLGLSRESGTTASKVSLEALWKMSRRGFNPARDWQKAAILTMHLPSRDEKAST